MKSRFHSFPIPSFHSSEAAFCRAKWANSAVQQRIVSTTIQPVKALFLTTNLSSIVPAEVESFADLKGNVFQWIGWLLSYGVAYTLGLYLFFLLTFFCVTRLRRKQGKRKNNGGSVQEVTTEIHFKEEAQPRPIKISFKQLNLRIVFTSLFL
ncbi:hypothetical protein [Adhaeribacter radiodurans]|uniref:Uncharacterized protein n=1 Tax=Adhaeribacter radiodurans TaxID=2745197 RepID=A0A7L7L5R0_9BACT|nr:hypothetical protein [Adhaeribacter radiodurans]QMU28146.1 hypothetical protein HUW48_08855 [Adhaeribacter radiodurans]